MSLNDNSFNNIDITGTLNISGGSLIVSYPDELNPDYITDVNNNISVIEKLNTLWKTYNSVVNVNPASYFSAESVPFNNQIINSEILNQNIPQNLSFTKDVSLNVILPNNQTIEFLITNSIGDISYLTVKYLDSLFDACDNILSGSKCNFENLGYKYIEYYYKRECYPTIYNTTNQIYTWFIPDPSNGNISNSGTKNLLKNTIPYLYDPYNNTYKFRLFYKNSSIFSEINFASNPDFAYLDNKSGFLYFYGGLRNGNNVTLDNIRSQSNSDPNKSPPYLSYIRYNGNTGFENLTMNGLINIDGSLNINNEFSFIDISENLYNVLNTKQIKEYINSLNISGGSGGGGGLTLDQILKTNNDASFNNVDISGFLKINQQDVAIKNYIDNSFTQISLFNELSSNFYDLSSNFSILDAQVQTICGANFALKINEISGDVLLIESDVISISGRIDNIKTIVNNLDVSYLTDSAFELSYNDLSNIYITNNLFNELSSNFSILESSFINLDLSNSLDLIDSSLTNLQNNIENINANISNKFSFDNIELLNTNSVVNIVNSNGNKYVFNDSNTYDASKNYGLRIGSYVLKDVSSSHPIALLNNDVSNLITYDGDVSKKYSKSISGTTADANYDFYYGDVSINVLGDFGNVSVYCYNHTNMYSVDLLQYVSNYYTTISNGLQDLSSLFFNTITPTKNTSNILININANLYCSYALEERISVQLWRDLSMLNQSNNLGSIIATGGLTIPYNLNYLDTPNNISLTKYYLKYILENNNSLQEMGLINIQNSSNYGNSNIILREI